MAGDFGQVADQAGEHCLGENPVDPAGANALGRLGNGDVGRLPGLAGFALGALERNEGGADASIEGIETAIELSATKPSQVLLFDLN